MNLDIQKIQIQLARRSWSQADLASVMGVTPTYVCDLFGRIRKDRPVTTKVAGKLAKALGVDVAELVADQDTKQAA